ncbi:MAG: D-sedoheptulose 7-phosphate isomerase [Syntrophobacterales bacterium]|nr:D-sedoheptulose 7-phosphate isomerase [Syntrophobacterales bacterium]
MEGEELSYITAGLEEVFEVFRRVRPELETKLIEIARLLVRVFRSQHRVFIFGNGGSAADAQHIATEFVNRFEIERPPLPAIALTTNTSILTSVSNDRNFNEVFVRQLQAMAEPGDAAFGISTSGMSSNVIMALRWAKEHGLHTIGFMGETTTEMDTYCDIAIHVPSSKTPRIQECHILMGHLLCGLVERMLYREE